MRFITKALLAALVAAPVSLAAHAQAPPSRGGVVEGEIIQVRQSIATQNEGAMTEIRVRDQQRQESWLRLGLAEEMGQRFQIGHRVRARVLSGAAGEPLPVTTIENLTQGDRLRLRTKDGILLRDQDRDRDRDRRRDRDRIHQPGKGSGQRQGRGGSGGR